MKIKMNIFKMSFLCLVSMSAWANITNDNVKIAVFPSVSNASAGVDSPAIKSRGINI